MAWPRRKSRWSRRLTATTNTTAMVTTTRRSHSWASRQCTRKKSSLTPAANIEPRAIRSAHNLGSLTMWVRQCDLDTGSDFRSPIPTRIVSNEEFVPPPQLPEQKHVEARLSEMAERQARRLGLDRRGFLSRGVGMAAALLAMNEVFGP